MKKTYQTYSFGCRVNHAEMELLARELRARGFTHDPRAPQVFIINTCAVTQKAEREARQLIYRMKREHPNTKLVVTGCAATDWLKRGIVLKEVDYLVENADKEHVSALIERHLDISEQPDETVAPPRTQANLVRESGRLFIKIQDGCHRFCSFCIVPYLRGLPRSVPSQKIIHTIQSEKQLSEAILVAINTEAYGKDANETFLSLLSLVFNKTDVPRISFGSVHPWSITPAFIDWYRQMADSQRLVRFLHIPLQSGSDTVLGRMKRGYSASEHRERLETIYATDQNTFIGTDVIAGFLGETDKEFSETYSFLNDAPIHKFHVFRYSPRSHTAAFYMEKRIARAPSQIVTKRARALRALSNKKYELFLQKQVNRTSSALLLSRKTGGYQEVLLDNQIPALIKAQNHNAGEITMVKITDYKNNRLFGTIV